MPKDLFNIGEIPPLGFVPKKMYAQTIRRDRFGEPKDAFQIEEVNVPELGPHDVLVLVMAAGVNYNNVWAAKGKPVDVISMRQKMGETEDFHIGGSDGAGIVWKIGEKVKDVKVGDEVVLHVGVWDMDCPYVKSGKDPMLSPTVKAWGFETNWGSFGQFCKVQARQCLPKPEHLTWEESSTYILAGGTAYRMLRSWPPHTVQEGDVVLVWGGAGGIGCMAIQIAKLLGGRSVAVVSDDKKAEYCKRLGAVGVINRREFSHWGPMPDWRDKEAYGHWLKGVHAFGEKIWEVLGEKTSPRIVFEHPGEETIPTSLFVCDTGGMVVTCAGTSGFGATFDLRYHWMRQKRFQGSHGVNDKEASEFNSLVRDKKIDPCLGKTLKFSEIGIAHQHMSENRHPGGKMAVLVNSPRLGLKTLNGL